MNFFKKKKVLWKKHIIFSSSFFGHCLKKFRPCYVSSGKIWGKTLNFLKNIQVFLLSGNFRYKTGTFSSSLSNLHCTCQWEHFERKLFFVWKETSSFITFRHCAKNFRCCLWFFSAGLPKLLPTCLWKQYEEKRFLKERLYFLLIFVHQKMYFVPDGRSFSAVLSKKHSTCPCKQFEET